jgi:hypothetical protein
MPEDTTPKGIPDPAANNAAVARQQAAQDIAGQSTVTGEFGDASSALDKLAESVVPVAPDSNTTPPETKPEGVTPDPAAEAAAKAATEAAAKAAEELKKADEFFKDSPKLPPNASPKSSEAFSTIKIKAAQEISAREQKIADLEKKLAESGKPSTDQLEKEKEAEELRQWRAKLDVEFDPKFKEYDKNIEKQREFIYAQLLQNPAIKPEVIDQIKKYGGPEKVNMVKIFEAVGDPTLQRLVEAKIADIQMAHYEKTNAIKSAKENLTQYLETRQQESTKTQIARSQETQTQLEGMLGNLDWFKEKQAEASADEATKKEAAEHNEFLGKLKGELKAALQDDSPQMKAIQITGLAQLFHLQRRVPALEAKLAAAEKQLSETTAKWEAVKASGRSRLHESAAPAGGIPVQKAGVDVNQRAGDALDAIAKQVMEEQAAKAGR